MKTLTLERVKAAERFAWLCRVGLHSWRMTTTHCCGMGRTLVCARCGLETTDLNV